VSSNCSKILTYAKRAKHRGCGAVVFPEMIDTGYDMSMLDDIASTWDEKSEDTPFATARDAAKSTGIYLFCGLSERVGKHIYNSTAVFDPHGELIGKYRKMHLAAYALFNEDNFIEPGDSFETVQVGDMTWGLIICYDIRFPELSRKLVLDGASVIQVSSAFPFPRLMHWRTILRARAIENQSYVVAANRVGTDAGVTFCGASCIIDPYGVTTAAAAEDREELIVGEVSKDLLSDVREQIPFLKQRREDLY
jgi:predicted amidohydrolase